MEKSNLCLIVVKKFQSEETSQTPVKSYVSITLGDWLVYCSFMDLPECRDDFMTPGFICIVDPLYVTKNNLKDIDNQTIEYTFLSILLTLKQGHYSNILLSLSYLMVKEVPNEFGNQVFSNSRGTFQT